MSAGAYGSFVDEFEPPKWVCLPVPHVCIRGLVPVSKQIHPKDLIEGFQIPTVEQHSWHPRGRWASPACPSWCDGNSPRSRRPCETLAHFHFASTTRACRKGAMPKSPSLQIQTPSIGKCQTKKPNFSPVISTHLQVGECKPLFMVFRRCYPDSVSFPQFSK